MQWLFFICILFFAPDSFAEGSTFSLDQGDKAQQMLSNIFGGNIGPLTLYGNSSNPILSLMFQRLNIIVVTLGVIVLSYIGIISTINTAHEGEAMGKKWSSVWVPLKALFGMMLMVPTPTSGYSLVQVAVMWVVLQGIGAANSIWSVVLNQMATGISISGNIKPKIDTEGLKKLTLNVLDASLCQAFFNKYEPRVNSVSNGTGVITITTSPDSKFVQLGGISNPTTCGQFYITGNNSTDREYKKIGLLGMFDAIRPVSEQLASLQVSNPNIEDLYPLLESLLKNNLPLSLEEAITNYTNQMTILAAQVPPDNSRKEIIEKSRKDGMAYVGNYYYALSGTNRALNNETENLPKISGTDFPPNENQFSNATLKDAPSDSTQYKQLQKLLNTVNGTANTALGKEYNAIADVGLPNADAISGLFSVFNGVIKQLQDNLSSENNEPVLAIATYGSQLMSASEKLLMLAIATGVALTAGAFCSAQLPLGGMMTTLANMLFLLAGALALAVWALGASLAVFLPMIPYMIYTVTFLGWLVSVIEAMIAAPILALGLITPGGEELGKATHGIMILTNVCLKPMLMVFGFIMASRLVRVAISMVNYGFLPALASISSSGATISPIFGWIAILILYVGFVLSLTNKCFSLIYLVPNKIMRWIGSQGDDFGEEGIIQQSRQTYDHGTGEVARTLGGALKEAGSNIAKKTSSNQNEDGSKGGEGRGGPAAGG